MMPAALFNGCSRPNSAGSGVGGVLAAGLIGDRVKRLSLTRSDEAVAHAMINPGEPDGDLSERRHIRALLGRHQPGA